MLGLQDAEPGDAAAFAAVHIASWRVAYRNLLPADVLAGLSVDARARAWTQRLLGPQPRTAVLVAVTRTGVVGFASVGPCRDAADTRSGDGELYAIYLHPDHWGRGVGSQLHDAAVRRLSTLGFTRATLWLLADNDRAAAFYRRTGWRADGAERTEHAPGGVELPERRLHRTLPTS